VRERESLFPQNIVVERVRERRFAMIEKFLKFILILV